MIDIKILRQNQEAGGKILKQDESAGGKIIKQNYNFGNAFRCPSANIYLKSTKNVNHLSIIAWIDPGNNRGNMIGFNNGNSEQSWALSYNNGPDDHDFFYYNNGALTADRIKYLGSVKRFIYIKDSFFRVNDTNDNLSNLVTLPLDSKLEIFNGAGPHNFNPSLYKIGLLRLYNVDLLAYQLDHEFNKTLGNNAYLPGRLDSEYTFNAAETISIDGIDKVCIRDQASDNHLEIINLPAGTLQEKLDYANNNFIVRWN